jgi:Flp pilus assembly pilin Flp
VGQLMRRLRSCDSGTGLVEYGLLLAVLALGLVGVLTLLRKSVEGLTTSVSVAISQPGSGGHVPPASTVPTLSHTRPTANMPVPAGSDGDSDNSEDPSADPDSSTAEPDSSIAATRASIWLLR